MKYYLRGLAARDQCGIFETKEEALEVAKKKSKSEGRAFIIYNKCDSFSSSFRQVLIQVQDGAIKK